MNELKYLENELYHVAPLPVMEGGNGQFSMQIRSEKGNTRWIDITPKQFAAMETALLMALEEMSC